MQEGKPTPQEIVENIIKECETQMPLCYTEEAHKQQLGNMICEAHIQRLKDRKAAK